MEIIEEIERLKREKNAVILAHYYVDEEVQKIADCVGDSYYLSRLAVDRKEKNIIFCGVSFMGESAKILSRDKNVYMADDLADCPMAHMIDEDTIKKVRSENDDVAVVCYVNSTAKIKACSDVCVTSSNAVKVVKRLKNKKIFFIPDNNLGRFVAMNVPDKEFILHDGFCHVHKSIHAKNVLRAKELHIDALVLAHPECTEDVIAIADYVGSTKGIIEYAKASDAQEYIICTEMGILYELNESCKGKKFYAVGHRQFCPNMKRITVDKVRKTLIAMNNPVILDDNIIDRAYVPLAKMLELAAD